MQSVASAAFATSESSVAWILGDLALPSHIDPDHLALRWDGQDRTYAELRQRALSLAASLRDKGLQRGDRVVGQLLNRGETFELYFACAYAGLTFVPVNWRLGSRELEMILDDSDPGIIFTQPEVCEAMQGVAAARNIDIVMVADLEPGDAFEALACGPQLSSPIERTDPHLILYTSGTTGRPKGVMMGHQSILWFAFQQSVMYPAMDSETVLLLNSPTFNTAGINEQVIPAFLVGGCVAILPSKGWRAARMSHYIDKWQATHTIIYPSMMEPFLDADREQPISLATLRFVLTGGENCPPATLARFQARWPKAELHAAYGATETGVVTMIVGEEIGKHPGSIGRPTMGMAVRVEDADGRLLPPGEVGELWAAGGSISQGYWKAPELTTETLRDGWFKSGDLARRDPDGYLYLEGRSKDLIISKGQNIYPAEIENVLLELDAILESAVVGAPDHEWGEAVCAAVVIKPGRDLSAADVIAHVQQRLASYKKPRHVVFLEALPRNHGNKVLKAKVAEAVIARLEAV